MSDLFNYLSSWLKVRSIRMEENPENRLSFVFPYDAMDNPRNGLLFNDIYIPEEIVILILSYVPEEDLLKIRLVCKKWYNLVKTPLLWHLKYSRDYKKKPKLLPWYIYYTLFSTKWFTHNLLKNNCGKERFGHWKIIKNGGDNIKIEGNAVGCDPYSSNFPEFEGASTCFVSSYGLCKKRQDIPLTSNLIKYIVNKHKPQIQASEWICGRFDCGGIYELDLELYHVRDDYNCEEDYCEDSDGGICELCTDHVTTGKASVEFRYEANQLTQWVKKTVQVKTYKGPVDGISFAHEARDNQFWAGHYGPKMAGGVVRIMFDTIKVDSDEDGEEMHKADDQ